MSRIQQTIITNKSDIDRFLLLLKQEEQCLESTWIDCDDFAYPNGQKARHEIIGEAVEVKESHVKK